MSLLQIEHVQLAMPKGGEDDARKFHMLALGMEEVQKPENLAKRGGCWFQTGAVRAHLGVDADFHPAKKAHPAFIVSNLDTLRQKIVSLGYLCNDDEPLEGFHRTYVFDPSGNRIELMEPCE
jgi:catechol 2,3-dioxygenase-like lactoylglutathione lyase family enzyme